MPLLLLETVCAPIWPVTKTRYPARCVGSTYGQRTWQIT
ncbi:hypothetical protein LEMLEM_LOCUS25300 [Lemmus lemmus]